MGQTHISVDQLTLGLVPLGNLYRGVSDDEADAVLDRWWTLGLRSFDVAPVYGYGIAEERLGRFLRDKPRDQYRLSTKVGRLIRLGASVDPAMLADGVPLFRDTPSGVNPVFDFTRDGIRRSLVESFQRLGIERADIVYIHDPDDHVELAMKQALPALVELREEGLVGAIGVGVTTLASPARFVRETAIDCVLLAGRYTLLEQEALDDLLPICEQHHVSVLCGGVMNSGFLANPRIGASYDYRPTWDQALVDRALRIEEVCRRFDVPLKAAAIQFPLNHPAVSTVIIGIRSVHEAEESVRMFSLNIPVDLWRALASEGLLRLGVPLERAN